MTLRGGGGKTFPRAVGVAERVIKNAEVVIRQKAAGAVDAFVFVRLAEPQATLKTFFNLRQRADVFGGVAADEIHVKQSARELKIRIIGQRFFRFADDLDTGVEFF